jgi:hypothetical protein
MVMSIHINPVYLPTVLLFCLSSFSLFAQSDPAVQAAELVGDLRDSMYLQDIDDDALYRKYRITLADLER